MTTTTPHYLVPCTCGHRAGGHDLHIGGGLGDCEHCGCRTFTAAPCPSDACPDCHHRWTEHTPRDDGELEKAGGGCYHRVDRLDDNQSVDRPGYDGEKWCPCTLDVDGVDRTCTGWETTDHPHDRRPRRALIIDEAHAAFPAPPGLPSRRYGTQVPDDQFIREYAAAGPPAGTFIGITAPTTEVLFQAVDRRRHARAALAFLGVDGPEALVDILAELGTLTAGHVRVAVDAYRLGRTDASEVRP